MFYGRGNVLKAYSADVQNTNNKLGGQWIKLQIKYYKQTGGAALDSGFNTRSATIQHCFNVLHIQRKYDGSNTKCIPSL